MKVAKLSVQVRVCVQSGHRLGGASTFFYLKNWWPSFSRRRCRFNLYALAQSQFHVCLVVGPPMWWVLLCTLDNPALCEWRVMYAGTCSRAFFGWKRSTTWPMRPSFSTTSCLRSGGLRKNRSSPGNSCTLSTQCFIHWLNKFVVRSPPEHVHSFTERSSSSIGSSDPISDLL